MKKSLVILAGLLTMSHPGSAAADFTHDTPVENNWKVTVTESMISYRDGTVLGIDGNYSAPEPAVLSAGKGKISGITSPGTVNLIIRPDPLPEGRSHNTFYGIYDYSSTGGEAIRQVTRFTVDTDLLIDLETAPRQNPGSDDGLASAISLIAQPAAGKGEPGDSATTYLTAEKNVTVNMVNKTVEPDSGMIQNTVYGLETSTFNGGVNHVAFKKDLNITGSVETDKNIWGISLQDQGQNGAGSTYSFDGNTNLDLESTHGGRVWGLLAYAADGTQTLSTGKDSLLDITATQRGGRNFVEAFKFNTGMKGRDTYGIQKGDFKGKTRIVSNGDYYATSFSTSNYGEKSVQTLDFGDDASFTAKAASFSYAANLNGNAGTSDIVFRKKLDLTAEAENLSYGIYALPDGKNILRLTAEGPADIKVHTGTGKAYGVYSKASGTATGDIRFSGGLHLSAASRDSMAILPDAVTAGDTATSSISADGDILMEADSASDYAAISDGKGASVTLNRAGGHSVKAQGITLADHTGSVDWNLDTPGSSLTGNITARNGGSVRLDVSGPDTWYRGAVSTDLQNGSATDMTLKDTGLWKLTGSSSVRELSLNNASLVDMSHAEGFQALVMRNLSGDNGTFLLDIDASRNTENSDQLYVLGTFTGTQYLDLNEVGHGELDKAAGTVLASVNDNRGTFLAPEEEDNLYWNRYILDKKVSADTSGLFTTDWYLKKVEHPDRPTTTTETGGASSSLLYHTWRNGSDKWLQRMGDLRHQNGEPKGLWVRIKGDKIGHDGSYGFTNRYTTYQIGYDEANHRRDKREIQGAAFIYAKGDSTYGRGSGDNRETAITLYSTELSTKDHYLDLVLKAGRLRNDFTVYDVKGRRISGKDTRNGVTLSGEYGRKKPLGKQWFVEPQTQLSLGYLQGSDYGMSNGTAVHNRGVRSAVGRIGFNLGRDLDSSRYFYLKANLLHEFGGYMRTSYTRGNDCTVATERHNDTWLEWGAGLAMALGKNRDNHLYFDVERSSGSSFKKDWQWNAGARFTFR